MVKQRGRVLTLLERSGERLHALLARLTRDDVASGDLFQDLFCKLSDAKGLERAKDPDAYAFRVAINLAFAWRRMHRLKMMSLEAEALPDRNHRSVLGEMIAAEELEQTREALEQLPEPAREVVVMRFIEQEPYEQIARWLGKSEHYLRSVCSKALARLRKRLAEKEGCEERKAR